MKYYTLKMFLWDALSLVVMALILGWFSWHSKGRVDLYYALFSPTCLTLFYRWWDYRQHKKNLKKAHAAEASL